MVPRCGGRDKWKRPEFGAAAAKYCDEIILTDEDPYDEEPTKIISEIKSGIPGIEHRASSIEIVPDRREAIKKAVSLMREGDIVVGTGKGSEDWIHVAHGKRIPWNEKKEFEQALEERRRQDSQSSETTLG